MKTQSINFRGRRSASYWLTALAAGNDTKDLTCLMTHGVTAVYIMVTIFFLFKAKSED